MPNILSIGTEASLIVTRGFTLIQAGYPTVMASDTKLGLATFLAGKFDLVILCNSIPQETRDNLTAQMRRFSPDVAILEFDSGVFVRKADGGPKARVDGLLGPEEYLGTIMNLFRNK